MSKMHVILKTNKYNCLYFLTPTQNLILNCTVKEKNIWRKKNQNTERKKKLIRRRGKKIFILSICLFLIDVGLAKLPLFFLNTLYKISSYYKCALPRIREMEIPDIWRFKKENLSWALPRSPSISSHIDSFIC